MSVLNNEPHGLKRFRARLQNQNNIIWVEIGVHKARSPAHVFARFNIEKMYLIDPYTALSYCSRFETQPRQDQHKKTAHEALEAHKEKCIWLEDFSENVVDTFEDNSVDVVFIDGDHSYEAVLRDLKNYYPKVRPGGIIAGDDYHEEEVQAAVKEFQKNFDPPFLLGVEGGNRGLFWFTKKEGK